MIYSNQTKDKEEEIMCQGKTAISNEPKSNKVYVVTFTAYVKDDTPDYALKVFSSKLRAKAYCEQKASHWSGPGHLTVTCTWVDDYTIVRYVNGVANCKFEIDETDIDDEVPADFHYPQIEKENEVLRNECYRLRKELADVTQRNAVAATYATMWDGGKDYTKERVLDNLQIVKDVLAGDHQKVRELYESWKKNEEER